MFTPPEAITQVIGDPEDSLDEDWERTEESDDTVALELRPDRGAHYRLELEWHSDEPMVVALTLRKRPNPRTGEGEDKQLKAADATVNGRNGIELREELRYLESHAVKD